MSKRGNGRLGTRSHTLRAYQAVTTRARHLAETVVAERRAGYKFPDRLAVALMELERAIDGLK